VIKLTGVSEEYVACTECTLKMKAGGYFETLVDRYQTARCHIAEDSIIFTYLRANHRLYKIKFSFIKGHFSFVVPSTVT
jgi:hypothetical protein